MEHTSAENRNKSTQNKSKHVNIPDSNYGSIITGTSSSSSISLSLFSESDLVEAPSTSGCSSEMASAMQSREKKERAKEFMKKLKSMLPMKARSSKMDTLSTLEHLVNSMRQLNEEHKRDSEFKVPPPHTGFYHGIDAERLSQSAMQIYVSQKNHVIHLASAPLMEHLGYPVDWWKGRVLKDFVNKRDINTVNSCIALHCSEDEQTETSDTLVSSSTGGGVKESSKYFYARIRRFRKLGSGFSLQNVISYCPFMMMVTSKSHDQAHSSDDEGSRHRKCLVIYCHPLSSAFTDTSISPKQWKFSLRHSIFCNYTYVHPNAVCLLGFLPQDFNGMSIFDLYHPDDFQQLLEIHKKIVLSMGQPFKSGSIRLRTRNGCYVEVETEWSSFMNPWSMRLEFIIGQHTVIKGPSHADIFEDLAGKPEKAELPLEARKIQDSILEVLKKPIQGVCVEQSAVGHCVTDQTIGSPVQRTSPILGIVREPDTTAKVIGSTDKSKGETESQSTLIDDKGVSSIYNQLNYSHNIKRFLMSHPKSFSNVSDEDSVLIRDDSEDEVINDDEEMPLEIPVVKPPSCGSSTQVHVSEQGHAEDMLNLPTFGDETVPPRDLTDNIHLLTEETLKKHTKIQERLYLQRIAEEQPLLLNMRRIKCSRNTSHQKRPRIREAGEDVETAKHPCTNSGVFRSSSNIFMQSFPAVTSSNLTPAPASTQPMFHQSKIRDNSPFDSSFLGKPTQLGFQPFPSTYQTGNQGNMGIPVQPRIHLVTGDTMSVPCLPSNLQPLMSNNGLGDIHRAAQPQNMQWPYYPQTGYTLLPQVMTGFYRPVLQPVQVQTFPPQTGGFGLVPSLQEPVAQDETRGVQPAKKSKIGKFEKKNGDSDNRLSSVDETTSSIMYLLEADSSTFEDSDNKASTGITRSRVKNRRSPESPWLRGIKWNADTKMRYTMPKRKTFLVLKMDEKMLKKTQQSELVHTNLKQLLQEISLPEHENPMDEEADYLFYPGDEALDDSDKNEVKTEVVDITQGNKEANHGGSSGGNHKDVVWGLAACENDDENYDTPVNSHSEDEKAPSTPVKGEEEEKEAKAQESSGLNNSKTETEDRNMDTVFISNSQAADAPSLTTRGSSPKDGSLSGDECSGSDGGQKAEMEDSQSNCSKVSSDLTPSDNRSNEEAASSMKESDTSLKNMKGVPSVASSNSSNDHNSQEETLSSALRKSEDVFRKLFVPLKVEVCQKLDIPSAPYWLVEAHLSQRVAMTYKVPCRQLDDVLNEDRKNMSNLVQSATVKHQLLQLLNDVDTKSHPINDIDTKSQPINGVDTKSQPITNAASVLTSGFLTVMATTPSSLFTQSSSLSSDCCLKSIKEEPSSDDKSTDAGKSMDEEQVSKAPLDNAIESKTSMTGLHKINTDTESFKHHQSASPESCFPADLSKTLSKKASPNYKETEEHSSSDTITDHIVQKPKISSSNREHSSFTDTSTLCASSSMSCISSRTDSHIQEKLQAMGSTCFPGQSIEDIIMSQVFLPPEVPSTSSLEAKNPPLMFHTAE